MSDSQDSASRLAAILERLIAVQFKPFSAEVVQIILDANWLLNLVGELEASAATHRDRATALTQELAVAKAERDEAVRQRDVALAVALRVGTSIFDVGDEAAGRQLARSFAAWSVPLMREETARLAQLILAAASPAAEVPKP